MKLALAQMVSCASISNNLAIMTEHVERAAALGARLIIFPENCLTMQTSAYQQLADAIDHDDNTLQPIAQLAQQYSMHIILGSVPMKTQSHRVRAATLVYNSKGCMIARYDKIHLFDASVGDAYGRYRESDVFAPGDELVTVQIGDFCFGLSICYDLRFPLLYQQLRKKGAHVFICPAAFTQRTGDAHWQPLLRARAIENQCYMLGVGQAGWHSATRETYGHTMAVDPWGQVIGQLEKGVGLLVVDIERQQVIELREKMPVFDHQKPL